MILFDTETTSLISNTLLPLRQQPKITEFSAFKLHDQTLEVIDEIDQLLNPLQPLEQEIIDITHITDDMLKGQPTFPEFYPRLVDFFLGERLMISHNLAFDRNMLIFELRRIDCEFKFPWPPKHECTVEMTEHLEGKRLSLTDLHVHLFNEPFPEAHRAKIDVAAMARCYKELVNRGII